MEEDMEKYKDKGDIDKYNELVEKFNELLKIQRMSKNITSKPLFTTAILKSTIL